MTALEQRLAAAGFAYPAETLEARTAARVGLPLALAVLMEETHGGANEYGHDTYERGGVVHRAPAWGWGAVTAANYRAFRALVRAVGVSNGVGPMQLTSLSLLAEADQYGGAWVPRHNIAVGLHYLHDNIRRYGLEAGVAAYNGTGPAAEEYARRVLALANHYRAERLGTVVGLIQ